MKRLLTIFFLIIASLWMVVFPVEAIESQAGASAFLKENLAKQDKRPEVLACFLSQYKSPLTPYADEFVKAADNYGLDYRLVPAITGVESTFGKRIPYGSYNAYGWANGAYRFDSWSDSIWHVNRVLKEKYVDRGAETVFQIGKIYAASPAWPSRVAFFMGKIDTCKSFVLTL